ncbi:uncharacterized protein E6C27_scaffold40G001170 [Cucumis melo var. makuwa]|uniref:Uncharacterized protein n=1 Tax=Cucumis melo var. makuwa TaxID=1194695 RepID=A0A5A7VPF7_CUCMM|nr:uncharacterized protein E6C27_scaffold40G001170 [Cucumis melo var. makuwa]
MKGGEITQTLVGASRAECSMATAKATTITVKYMAFTKDNITKGYTIQPNTTIITTTLLHLLPNQWNLYFVNTCRQTMAFCKPGASRKEKGQVVTLRSGRNLTIRKPDSECRNPTSASTTEIDSSSKNSQASNFSLINDASSLQNNNEPNKEVESTRREEPRGEASNQMISSNALSPPPFPGRLKKKTYNQQFAKVLEKMTNLGSFTVPCSIDGMDLGCALCNLGASIDLMPLFIYKKLKIWEVQPTYMRLQCADRSIAKPEGNIEDILVKDPEYEIEVVNVVTGGRKFKPLDLQITGEKKAKPSMEKPPELELQSVPQPPEIYIFEGE